MAPSQPVKPQPRLSPDNAVFWEKCKEHALHLPFCKSCGKPHLPPGPVCPFCLSDALEWRPVSGRGHISSWTIIRQGGLPAFRDEVPYNVVQVELDEGPRLTSSVVAPDDDLAIGQAVEVVFEEISGGAVIPRFRRTGSDKSSLSQGAAP